MKTQQRLIADVHPGDSLVFRDDVYGISTVLVSRVEWDSTLPMVKINDEMIFAKDAWVEVVV